MRSEIFTVIEKARRLQIAVDRSQPVKVRIDLSPAQFESRLIELHDALEQLDSSGSLGLQGDDERRAKAALNAVSDWVKKQNLDASDLKETLRQVMKPSDTEDSSHKSRPRYFSIDPTGVATGDIHFVDATTRKIEAILGSIRSDLSQLHELAGPTPDNLDDADRFKAANRIRAIEDGLCQVLDNVRARFDKGTPEINPAVDPRQAQAGHSLQERLNLLVGGAQTDPRVASFAAMWKRVISGILINDSLSSVSITFEDFRMMNRMMSELLDGRPEDPSSELGSEDPVPRP